MTSYLNNRSQYTHIGGKNSNIVSTTKAVPQGSVLGPLIYMLYINEMPDAVNKHDTCEDAGHIPGEYLFMENCVKCGMLLSFAMMPHS